MKFFKKRNIVDKEGRDNIMKSKTSAKSSYYLNVSIWNNHLIMLKTGYTIEMISDTLHDMAQYLKVNLMGNRLNNFYLDEVRNLWNIPYC